ncbi:MAG: CerR family C-terminal domain-containing protein [Deltaproteobacteria bacterium]|nr:CerR family C-terminal domain-containing protein [Deltaproteobacteria bacterium]MBW2070287.1 CerR family C-terminal domain-containing protein [Deltaproteobacteria bacterium]
MAVREDGKETRKRLLEAGCQVFAEKGYQGARVADICRQAGANVAAVNYHFGDKAALYSQAWIHAFKKSGGPVLPDSGSSSPEEQLRIYIHSLIQYFTDQSAEGEFTRLYLMELANPTGLIQDIWHELIEPRRRVLLGIIRKIMGTKVSDEMVLFCEMSIINQCRTLHTIRRSDLEYLLGQPLSTDLIKRFADHVSRFSLAGIKAVGKYPD